MLSVFFFFGVLEFFVVVCLFVRSCLQWLKKLILVDGLHFVVKKNGLNDYFGKTDKIIVLSIAGPGIMLIHSIPFHCNLDGKKMITGLGHYLHGVCMWAPSLHGFSLRTLVSPHIPKMYTW